MFASYALHKTQIPALEFAGSIPSCYFTIQALTVNVATVHAI